jgi:predicted RNase H-like HicB family nuclease
VTHYIGILDGANDVWGVRIPDVPGCYGGGDTPEAALADAISALREVATHHAAEGVDLNPPRSMKDIIHDKEAKFNPRAGESLVMVPLFLDRHRPVKANISLDAGLLEAIDAEAQRRGLTRSAFLTSAALDKIRLLDVREHIGREAKGKRKQAITTELREKRRRKQLANAE